MKLKSIIAVAVVAIATVLSTASCSKLNNLINDLTKETSYSLSNYNVKGDATAVNALKEEIELTLDAINMTISTDEVVKESINEVLKDEAFLDGEKVKGSFDIDKTQEKKTWKFMTFQVNQ